MQSRDMTSHIEQTISTQSTAHVHVTKEAHHIAKSPCTDTNQWCLHSDRHKVQMHYAAAAGWLSAVTCFRKGGDL